MFTLFSVLALCFLSEITLFAIFDNDKSCFTCNIIPNKRALFPFFKTSNNPVPASNNKTNPFL